MHKFVCASQIFLCGTKIRYRRLEKGEIIQCGDQIDRCANPWKDEAKWEPAGNIGEPAPDPQYPSHRQYRRPVMPSGYDPMMQSMRRSRSDLPGVIGDVRACLCNGIDVPHGQALAVIDFLLEENAQQKDSIHGLRSALNSVMGVQVEPCLEPTAASEV